MPRYKRSVFVALLDGDKVLTVTEKKTGEIGFPGGKAEGDESWMKALSREFREEIGARLPFKRFTHVGWGTSQYEARIFVARLTPEEARTLTDQATAALTSDKKLDVASWQWTQRDTLQSLNLRVHIRSAVSLLDALSTSPVSRESEWKAITPPAQKQRPATAGPGAGAKVKAGVASVSASGDEDAEADTDESEEEENDESEDSEDSDECGECDEGGQCSACDCGTENTKSISALSITPAAGPASESAPAPASAAAATSPAKVQPEVSFDLEAKARSLGWEKCDHCAQYITPGRLVRPPSWPVTSQTKLCLECFDAMTIYAPPKK